MLRVCWPILLAVVLTMNASPAAEADTGGPAAGSGKAATLDAAKDVQLDGTRLLIPEAGCSIDFGPGYRCERGDPPKPLVAYGAISENLTITVFLGVASAGELTTEMGWSWIKGNNGRNGKVEMLKLPHAKQAVYSSCELGGIISAKCDIVTNDDYYLMIGCAPRNGANLDSFLKALKTLEPMMPRKQSVATEKELSKESVGQKPTATKRENSDF